MSAISPHDLVYMRSVAQELMPDLCTIQTRTQTQDALGGVTLSWTTTYTDIKCRLDKVSGGPVQGANWMATLPFDQPFTLEDRIVTDDLTIEPVDLNTGRSWLAAKRAWCRLANQ